MAYSIITPSPSRASWSPKSVLSEAVSSTIKKEEEAVEEDDIVQGRLFWLPPKEELPVKAVRRAHGKGAVEEGIYNHPIIVISRPAEDGSIVHFHLITSFQGKKLHEKYGKSSEFHTSRRSWYLPISPAPDHPDANSKKSKKRFPTLKLADGAVLRWDSYVNLRHVYKIDWTCLRPYNNPDTPWSVQYRLERESVIRMLAKGRVLTTYEAGAQYPRRFNTYQAFQTPEEQLESLHIHDGSVDPSSQPLRSPVSDGASITSEENTELDTPQQSTFLGSCRRGVGGTQRPSRAPPDGKCKNFLATFLGAIV